MVGHGPRAPGQGAVIRLPVAYREQVRAKGKRTTYLRRALGQVDLDVRTVIREADFRIEGGPASGSYLRHEGRCFREVGGDLPIPEAYPIDGRVHDVEVDDAVVIDDDLDVAIERVGTWAAANAVLVSGRLFAAVAPPRLLVAVDPLERSVKLTAGMDDAAPGRMVFPLAGEEAAWAHALAAARLLGCEPVREAKVTFYVDPQGLGLDAPSPEAQAADLAGRAKELGLDGRPGVSALHALGRSRSPL